MAWTRVASALCVLGLWATGPVLAAETTRVVRGLGAAEDRFDLHLTLDWLMLQKQALVMREFQSGLSPERSELVKDLVFHQTRHVLMLRGAIGIIGTLSMHLEAPLVLADERRLEFDQRKEDDCVFAGDPGARPDCVNEMNSPLLRDGILPGYQSEEFGFDAVRSRAYTRPSSRVFRGPVRRGLEYVGVGLSWAAFDQVRDMTKPTWILGVDGRLDLAKDMAYDPARPRGNRAVGPGFHQIVAYTKVSRRFRRFDPYFNMWYALPVRTSDGLFDSYNDVTQSRVDPQQAAGVVFGFEGVTWEDARRQQRVTLELRARLEGRLEGRGLSELWEPLSGSSLCRVDPANCRAGIDRDLNGDGTPDPFPGVTDIESYALFGADAGLNVQVGQYVRFRGLFGLTMEQPHFITFADAGEDRDGNGRVDTSDPSEVNPAYREVFDLPGRRYRVEQTQIWTLFIEASLMF